MKIESRSPFPGIIDPDLVLVLTEAEIRMVRRVSALADQARVLCADAVDGWTDSDMDCLLAYAEHAWADLLDQPLIIGPPK